MHSYASLPYLKHHLLLAGLLASSTSSTTTTTTRTTTGTELRQLILAHRPLPLPPQLGDGQVLLGHGGLELVQLLAQPRHLPLVVRGVAAGVRVQAPREAEGRARVALHPGLVLQAALELRPGRPALGLGQRGAALGLGGLGRRRVALGAEGGAFRSEAGLGLDAAGGRAGVGLGRLDGAEEVL